MNNPLSIIVSIVCLVWQKFATLAYISRDTHFVHHWFPNQPSSEALLYAISEENTSSGLSARNTIHREEKGKGSVQGIEKGSFWWSRDHSTLLAYWLAIRPYEYFHSLSVSAPYKVPSLAWRLHFECLFFFLCNFLDYQYSCFLLCWNYDQRNIWNHSAIHSFVFELYVGNVRAAACGSCRG
jgi:hypothetical protein